MSLDQVVQSYKESENAYIKGIETPHGRIQILFDTIEINLDKLVSKHPKTDFVSYGKVLQAIAILAESLDLKNGGELADQLNELYAYCSKTVRAYLEQKDVKKLEEVQGLLGEISEGWKKIS